MTCNTTWFFRANCSGERTKCAHCGDVYCAYHGPPCGSVAQLVGGHNCPKYTAGAGLADALTSTTDVVTQMAGGSGFMSRAQVVALNELADWLDAQHISPNSRSEVSLLDLSYMAEAVYDLHGQASLRPEPRHPDKAICDPTVDPHPDNLRNWQVKDQLQQPAYAAGVVRLAMAVFVNTQTRVAVLALKGTDPGSMSDLHADGAGVVRGAVPTSPVKEAASLLKRWRSEGFDVMVTGHSLGGYMAEVLASHLGIAGAGFCYPGSGWHAGQKAGAGFAVVNAAGDGVIALIQGMPLKTSSHAYPEHTVDTGMGHSIIGMRLYWQKQPQVTNLSIR